RRPDPGGERPGKVASRTADLTRADFAAGDHGHPCRRTERFRPERVEKVAKRSGGNGPISPTTSVRGRTTTWPDGCGNIEYPCGRLTPQSLDGCRRSVGVRSSTRRRCLAGRRLRRKVQSEAPRTPPGERIDPYSQPARSMKMKMSGAVAKLQP